MSTLENDIFLEQKAEDYREAVANKEWEKLGEIGIELEEAGFGDKEIELSNELTAEEVREYKRWDYKVNGSIETQMDDNSADIYSLEN